MYIGNSKILLFDLFDFLLDHIINCCFFVYFLGTMALGRRIRQPTVAQDEEEPTETQEDTLGKVCA